MSIESQCLVSISIVSHGHKLDVDTLLKCVNECSTVGEIFLTKNIPEPDFNIPDALRSKTVVINNRQEKGFSFNHNQALKKSRFKYFCILNPDIKWDEDPFPSLINIAGRSPDTIIGPIVKNGEGEVEDSFRQFLTPLRILFRIWKSKFRPAVLPLTQDFQVDWIAGMFMFVPKACLVSLGGFDEKFHLYCEDADLCLRHWKKGGKISVSTSTIVVHLAKRESRKRLSFFLFHFKSLIYYFYKHPEFIFKVR